MKNRKLKSRDFFDVEQNPWITFKSTSLCRQGLTLEVEATSQYESVNPEKLTLTVSRKGTVQARLRKYGVQP